MPVNAGNAEVILTSAVEGQGFVSIDGKRTYLHLFENSDRTSTHVQAQPQPTRTQPPAVLGTGFVPLKSLTTESFHKAVISICPFADLLSRKPILRPRVPGPPGPFEGQRSTGDPLSLRLESTLASWVTRARATSVNTKRALLFKECPRATASRDTLGCSTPCRVKVRRRVELVKTDPTSRLSLIC